LKGIYSGVVGSSWGVLEGLKLVSCKDKEFLKVELYLIPIVVV
jgi:hypothetical protein